MNADAYYAIGSSHQVCQDHAIAGDDFVVLSDGCSSAKDSDWGSRFLTQAAYNLLKSRNLDITKIKLFSNQVLNHAQGYIDELELNKDCLAATLLGVFTNNNVAYAFIIGDGFIIARNRNTGVLTVISHMFSSGAPWYLYYNLHDDLTNGYNKYYGDGRLIVSKESFEGNFIDSKQSYYNISEVELNLSVSAGLTDKRYTNALYAFPIDEYDLIGVASDGLKSFSQQTKGKTSITSEAVFVADFINELFAFKNLEGQFVQRRCQKFLRESAAKNIKHTDDFSLGVLHV